MACPNSKNGPKNGLRPLQVKSLSAKNSSVWGRPRGRSGFRCKDLCVWREVDWFVRRVCPLFRWLHLGIQCVCKYFCSNLFSMFDWSESFKLHTNNVKIVSFIISCHPILVIFNCILPWLPQSTYCPPCQNICQCTNRKETSPRNYSSWTSTGQVSAWILGRRAGPLRSGRGLRRL
jgi:hypothetical protein